MSKLTCKCGNLLSTCSTENSVEGLLTRNDGWDYDDFSTFIEFWECDQCGMLMIFKENKCVKRYLPTDGEPGNLLKGLR